MLLLMVEEEQGESTSYDIQWVIPRGRKRNSQKKASGIW
jgi:hypothetical protein